MNRHVTDGITVVNRTRSPAANRGLSSLVFQRLTFSSIDTRRSTSAGQKDQRRADGTLGDRGAKHRVEVFAEFPARQNGEGLRV